MSKGGYSAAMFNTETLELVEINTIDSEVSACYLIEEDSELIYNEDIVDVKSGDIVFKLYSYKGERKLIVMGKNELTDEIKLRELARRANSQNEKLERVSSGSESMCVPD